MSVKHPPETGTITIVNRFGCEELPIPEWLRRARDEAGLSQREFARAIGMTQSQLSELEGGKTEPRPVTIQRLARAYGGRIEILVRHVETNEPVARLVPATLAVAAGPEPVVAIPAGDEVHLIVARLGPNNSWTRFAGPLGSKEEAPWPVLVCEADARRQRGPSVALIGESVTLFNALVMSPAELLMRIANGELPSIQ